MEFRCYVHIEVILGCILCKHGAMDPNQELNNNIGSPFSYPCVQVKHSVLPIQRMDVTSLPVYLKLAMVESVWNTQNQLIVNCTLQCTGVSKKYGVAS